MPATKLRRAFRFFHAHCGGIVGERAIYALELARAEEKASELGLTVLWECEDLPYEECLGDHAYWCPDEKAGRSHTHEVYFARLVEPADGDTLGSLGAIVDPDHNYRRVVEAELALEALTPTPPRAEKDQLASLISEIRGVLQRAESELART